MENKKYEILQNQSIELDGHTLYRIRALKNFSNVKSGDLGGYIENEDNLTQEGTCWVYNNAKVYGNAEVYDAAWICDYSKVYDNAKVYEDALIYSNARIYGSAKIHGNAEAGFCALCSDGTDFNAMLYEVGFRSCRGDCGTTIFWRGYDEEEARDEAIAYKDEELDCYTVLESFACNREKMPSSLEKLDDAGVYCDLVENEIIADGGTSESFGLAD